MFFVEKLINYLLDKRSILLYRGNQKNSTMPNNKTEHKTVEIKMDSLDTQTDSIIPGIRIFYLRQIIWYLSTFQVLGEKQLQHILKLHSRREA